MNERCGWAGPDAIYIAYHDEEWGVPVRDSRALWEKLMLDGFQAGLSWLTILKKRENFRDRFDGFVPEVVAEWGDAEIAAALADPGIVRHRGKIEATVQNARAYLDLEAQNGFAAFFWDRVDGRPIQNAWQTLDQVPAQTDLSRALSKDLRAAGFKFVGPTIVYSVLQAAGLVNDHLVTCPRYEAVAALGT